MYILALSRYPLCWVEEIKNAICLSVSLTKISRRGHQPRKKCVKISRDSQNQPKGTKSAERVKTSRENDENQSPRSYILYKANYRYPSKVCAYRKLTEAHACVRAQFRVEVTCPSYSSSLFSIVESVIQDLFQFENNNMEIKKRFKPYKFSKKNSNFCLVFYLIRLLLVTALRADPFRAANMFLYVLRHLLRKSLSVAREEALRQSCQGSTAKNLKINQRLSI